MSFLPSHLLSADELSALAVGDLVQRHDGDWFEVLAVYPAVQAGLCLTFPFVSQMVGATNVIWQDALVAPRADHKGTLTHGTDRSRVRFAPAPEPEALTVPAAAILANLPLADSLRMSVAMDDRAARFETARHQALSALEDCIAEFEALIADSDRRLAELQAKRARQDDPDVILPTSREGTRVQMTSPMQMQSQPA